MKKVFVSGCYDILHGGHIQFFEDARALGDHLTVCFASKDVLLMTKGRTSSMPDMHKAALIGAVRSVDRAVASSDLDPIFDFIGHWKKEPPQILAVTEDDPHMEKKRRICEEYGVELVALPKRTKLDQVSTTSILAEMKNLVEVPLRVDFAGGWLDVPSLSRKGAYIVNCAIAPKVSLSKWEYRQNSGLGGSAAYALLKLKNGIASEISLGVGWQDPAVISETGLCVWRSGEMPVLEAKCNPDWLAGKMLLVWTGNTHHSPTILAKDRDYGLIEEAGATAAAAVNKRDIAMLAKAVSMSYRAQLGEGMKPLSAIEGSVTHKYLGGGHGGYALYLFASKEERDRAAKGVSEAKLIEPYMREPA